MLCVETYRLQPPSNRVRCCIDSLEGFVAIIVYTMCLHLFFLLKNFQEPPSNFGCVLLSKSMLVRMNLNFIDELQLMYILTCYG